MCLIPEACWRSGNHYQYHLLIEWQQNVTHSLCHYAGFEISCKWIAKITCPNVPFTCLKYIKPMQLMSKSEIRSPPAGIPLVRLLFLLISDDRTSEISTLLCLHIIKFPISICWVLYFLLVTLTLLNQKLQYLQCVNNGDTPGFY